MRIILINPQIGFSPPFGLLYLGAVLEKKHNVEIVEFHSYNKKNFKIEESAKEIIDKKPDLVGITCMTAYIKIIEELIKILKKQNIPIICGGSHATALPEEMIKMGADIVTIGEGEDTILKVVDYYKNKIKLENIEGIAYKDKNIKINKKTSYIDVNKIPLPAYHLLNMNHYLSRNYSIRGYWMRNGWVLTSRGCHAKCTFCASYITHGYKIRERRLDDVIEELRLLKEKYRIEGFWVLDDTFTVNTKRVLEFCKKLEESNLKLKWGCQARVNCFNEEQAVALKKSKCLQIDFGVESGSQKILNYIKKGITVEQSKKVFEICRKHKLRALATFMVGTPNETSEDIQKTRDLLKQIKPDYAGIFFTTPYPGTEMYKEAVEKKWIDLKEDINWESNATPKFTMNFTKQELHKIYNSLIEKNFRKTVIDYVKQPYFLFDMVKFSLLNPIELFKLISLASSGKREDVINNFRELRIRGKV